MAGSAAAARALSAFRGGTWGADHARALRAAAATAAGVATKLLACHVAWFSEAEAGLRKDPPPRPNANTAGEAGPSSGRGSARTVSRRMRRTRARDAAGLQAEAEVAEGGAEESVPPASSDVDQDVRHESQIPAEHLQLDTESTSGGGDQPDGGGTDSASSWDTVEDDGGAKLEGRWKAAVVFGTAADGVDGRPGDEGPDAVDRPIVVRPVGVLSSAGAAVAGAGRSTRPRGDGSGGAAAARAAAAGGGGGARAVRACAHPRGPVGRHARWIPFVPGGEEETTRHG